MLPCLAHLTLGTSVFSHVQADDMGSLPQGTMPSAQRRLHGAAIMHQQPCSFSSPLPFHLSCHLRQLLTHGKVFMRLLHTATKRVAHSNLLSVQ